MLYLVGIIGFVGGFIFGQMVIYFLLRHKSREELLEDKRLKWKYGTLNWVIAGMSTYFFILTYKQYFT